MRGQLLHHLQSLGQVEWKELTFIEEVICRGYLFVDWLSGITRHVELEVLRIARFRELVALSSDALPMERQGNVHVEVHFAFGNIICRPPVENCRPSSGRHTTQSCQLLARVESPGATISIAVVPVDASSQLHLVPPSAPPDLQRDQGEQTAQRRRPPKKEEDRARQRLAHPNQAAVGTVAKEILCKSNLVPLRKYVTYRGECKARLRKQRLRKKNCRRRKEREKWREQEQIVVLFSCSCVCMPEKSSRGGPPAAAPVPRASTDNQTGPKSVRSHFICREALRNSATSAPLPTRPTCSSLLSSPRLFLPQHTSPLSLLSYSCLLARTVSPQLGKSHSGGGGGHDRSPLFLRVQLELSEPGARESSTLGREALP